MVKDTRWTPRRRPGGIYCSPACGAKCKRADFDRATKEAAKLAASLGEGWMPSVWENMGWFYKAHKGVCDIHRGGRRATDYTAYFNSNQQVIAQGATAKEALANVAKLAQEFVTELTHNLEELEVLVTPIELPREKGSNEPAWSLGGGIKLTRMDNSLSMTQPVGNIKETETGKPIAEISYPIGSVGFNVTLESSKPIPGAFGTPSYHVGVSELLQRIKPLHDQFLSRVPHVPRDRPKEKKKPKRKDRRG